MNTHLNSLFYLSEPINNVSFPQKTEVPHCRFHAEKGISKQMFAIPYLNQLVKNPLVSQKSIKANQLSETYSWEVERLKVFLQTVFSQGVTESDKNQIDTFADHLESLTKEIECLPLAKNDLKNALTKIDKTQAIVTEAKILIKKMEEYEINKKKLEGARNAIVQQIYARQDGNSLLAIESVTESVTGLEELISPFQEDLLEENSNGIVKTHLTILIEQDLNHLKWVIEDWAEAVETRVKNDLQDLSKVARTKEPYKALNRHLVKMQYSIDDSLKILNHIKIFPSKKMRESLLSCTDALKQTKKSLVVAEKQIKTKNFPAGARFSYGDEEWKELEKTFPSKKPTQGIFSKLIPIIDSENWSPKTKDIVYRIFTGMQLGQQIHGIVNEIGKAESMKQRADQLQQEALRTLSKEKLTLIKKESSLIGTLLSDKYSSILNEKTLEGLTKKYPEAQKNLKTFIAQQGQNPPSKKEVSSFLEAYKTHRSLSEGTASPFNHLSFSEWWNRFIAAEEEPFTATVEQQGPLLLSDQVFNTKKTSNVFSTVFKNETIQAFVSERFIQLNTAVKALSETQKILIHSSTISLREEAALLQRELLRTMAMTPADRSLSKAAYWVQQVEDQCYALEVLENRIDLALHVEKNSLLKASDEELHKYGKKHENIVKQARLAKALQISGIEVPLPQGVKSEEIHEFLQKNEPQIFKHWELLSQEYRVYTGTEPFLKQPSVQAHFKDMEALIDKAFSENILDFSMKMQQWLKSIKASNEYLMVRSTGAEDSRATANAGGNLSLAYILPEQKPLNQAIGEVVKSYFGYGSLQNRINAGLNPFAEDLKLAVTAQKLIGEPIGGTKNSHDVPISLVMFTNEPLYIGDEKFRVMRISATYGHGEGVVGNLGIASDTALILLSEAKPDELYILYDNQEKPERLVPVETDEGIRLQKMANPLTLANERALSPELLARLYHWGVIGEKFFNHPTDMELVIKKNTIYPLQARDINRPQLLPTYVDLKKLSSVETSPSFQKIHGEMIVPGKASVIKISNKEEVLFAETLEEAERAFVTKKHKLVTVLQQEPANSHPVVNFSALGIPCLFFKDKEKLENTLSQIDESHSLVACIQTASLHLFDAKANLDNFISKGFAVHPAKVAISLSVNQPTITDLPKDVPQEVKELLLAVQSETTTQAALKALRDLRNHAFTQRAQTVKTRLNEKLSSIKIVPKEAKRLLKFLNILDQKIQRAFDETEMALVNMEPNQRLEPLFHAKVIDSLLFSSTKGIGQYSMLDVESLTQEADALIDYQKQLFFPARYSNLLIHRQTAFTKEAESDWTIFLLGLEKATEEGKLSTKEIEEFTELLTLVQENNVLPLWMALFFNSASKSKDVIQTMQKLILEKKPSDKEFLKWLKVRKKELHSLNKQELCSKPETFDQGLVLLKQQVEKFSGQLPSSLTNDLFSDIASQDFHISMKKGSSLAKMIGVQGMKELVESFDVAIKQMKTSQQFTDLEKTKLFKQMLEPYLTLLEAWIKSEINEKTILTHKRWPIKIYLTKLREIYNNLSDSDISQLYPSEAFNVSCSMLGTLTDFDNYLPETLEDIFTLIHQNLLVCTGSINNDLLPDNILSQLSLSEVFKNALEESEKLMGEKIQGRSINIDSKEIIVKYNIPLRQHSASLELSCEKMTNEVIFKTHFYGYNEYNRWLNLAQFAQLLDGMEIISLASPVRQLKRGLSISWKVDLKKTPVILEKFHQILEYSFDQDLENMLSDVITQVHEEHEIQKLQYSLPKKFNIFFEPVYLFLLTHERYEKIISILENSLAIDYLRAPIFNFFDKPTLDYQDQKNIFKIYSHLVRKNEAYPQAFEAILKGIKNLDIFPMALNLLESLLDTIKDDDKAIKSYKKFFKLRGDVYNDFIFYRILLKKGVDHEAIQFANYITHSKENIRFSQNLFTKAVEASQGYEEALAFVERMMMEDEDVDFSTLLIALIKKGQGYKQSFDFAVKMIASNSPEDIYKGLEIYEELIKIGLGHKEFIEIANYLSHYKMAINDKVHTLLNMISAQDTIKNLNNIRD